MQHFRHKTTMLLAILCLLMASAVCAETTVTSCDSDSVQVLECAYGVIYIQSAFYGREDTSTCSEGRPASQLSNTMCSLLGVQDLIINRCELKQRCQIDMNDIRTSDPCFGTYKYLQTIYSCLPEHIIACENNEAHLFCAPGCAIFVYGAFYGRRDQTICSEGQLQSVVENTRCSNPTDLVAQSCNGQETCTISASTLVFGEPCYGTYKYLEVAYACVYPFPNFPEADVPVDD